MFNFVVGYDIDNMCVAVRWGVATGTIELLPHLSTVFRVTLLVHILNGHYLGVMFIPLCVNNYS